VLISALIPTIFHKLGHLIFGLIENYEFCAFGIGNYAFVKEKRKIKIKKYRNGNAGGYCIMIPPKPKNGTIPYFWFFFRRCDI